MSSEGDQPSLHATRTEHGVLEYRNFVEVGALAIQRHAGGVTITVRRSRIAKWAFVQAVGFLLLGVALAWFGFVSLRTPDRGGWIAGMVVCAIFVLTCLTRGMTTLFPLVYELNEDRLLLRIRGLTHVGEEVYCRSSFASLAVEKMRLKSDAWKREGVTLVYPNGFSLIVFRGTRAENQQFASLIAQFWKFASPVAVGSIEDIGLPWRVRRRTIGLGFLITFLPPIPWSTMLLAAIIIAVPASYLGGYIDDGRWHLIPRKVGLWQWMGIGGLIEVLACMAVMMLMLHLKRTTAIHYDATKFILVETGLRPCHATYSSAQIASVIHDAGNREVKIQLTDGGCLAILQRAPAAHRECAVMHLKLAIDKRNSDLVLYPVTRSSDAQT